MERITSLQETSEAKYKEKGSLFIGISFPVTSVDEAENILSEIRKKYYDATHHCYAYKLNDNIEKYSDDGEPTGTAGIRILNAISHFNLTNVLTIVVRYFGGVKLGVGPLGKAYYTSAFSSLENAPKLEFEKYNEITIKFDFEYSGIVHHFLNSFVAKEIKNEYENQRAVVEAKILSSKISDFVNSLSDATKRSVEILINEKPVYLPSRDTRKNR